MNLVNDRAIVARACGVYCHAGVGACCWNLAVVSFVILIVMLVVLVALLVQAVHTYIHADVKRSMGDLLATLSTGPPRAIPASSRHSSNSRIRCRRKHADFDEQGQESTCPDGR